MANNIQNVHDAISIAQSKHHSRYDELHEWMRRASIRDLHTFIIKLQPYDKRDFTVLSPIALQVRLAEEAAKTADKMAEQTNRLVEHTEKLTAQTDQHLKHSEKLTQQTDRLLSESVNLSTLTKVLIWLTVALWAAAVIQIFLMVYDIWKHK